MSSTTTNSSSIGFRLFMIVIVLSLAGMTAFAQVGKVEGKVVDSESGEPVVGASVFIPGTTIGAAADANGDFFILNVRPGTYEFRITAVGFAASIVENVQIVGGRTTSLETIQLVSEAITLEDVIIIAERPVVDRTQTSTRTTITSTEISALPVIDIHQLIGNTASSFDGFVRGGKRFETRTYVDGIDISDSYFASYTQSHGVEYGYTMTNKFDEREATTVNVNVSAVEELAINTGAVDADLGSATAGVVSLSLREGRGDLFGSLTVRRTPGGLNHFGPNIYHDEDEYFSERQSKIDADTPEQKFYTWNRDRYPYGDDAETDVNFTLGGTVFPNTHLFTSGRWFETNGRFPGEYRRTFDLTVRPTFDLGNNMRIFALGILEDRGEIFGWKNRRYSDLWRFFLEGVPVYDGYSSVASLRFSHVLSPQTYYDIQVGHTMQSNRQGFVDPDGDGQIRWGEWDGDFIRFNTAEEVSKYIGSHIRDDFGREKFFATQFTDDFSRVSFGGPGTEWRLARPIPSFEEVKTGNIQFRGDITTQATRNHLLRGGVQMRLFNISLDRLTATEEGFTIIPENRDIVPFARNTWERNPWELGFYVQDRMEYADLVINVGLRLDAYNRDAAELANYFEPYELVVGDDGITRYAALRGDKLPTEWYLSPRVGISHPISERAAMYFSFSQSTQLQPYSLLYLNYDGNMTPSRFFNLVEAGMDPIKSINYEIGMQLELLAGLGLDINAYYRDIENYGTLGFEVTQVDGPLPGGYYIQTGARYADSRGIELTLTQRPGRLTDWLTASGRLTYTYSYIKEAVYAGGNQTGFTGPGDSERLDGQLPFDDLRRYNTYERNVISNNSVLTGGYDRPHRVTISALFGFPYDFHFSIFGRAMSGFYYPLTLEDPRSRALGVGPSAYRFDMRFDKLFTLAPVKLRLFVDITNVFDNENILTYNRTDAAGGQRIWEEDGDPTGPLGRVITPDGSYVYDIPREIRMGLQIEF
jgi:hypothetical protein